MYVQNIFGKLTEIKFTYIKVSFESSSAAQMRSCIIKFMYNNFGTDHPQYKTSCQPVLQAALPWSVTKFLTSVLLLNETTLSGYPQMVTSSF